MFFLFFLCVVRALRHPAPDWIPYMPLRWAFQFQQPQQILFCQTSDSCCDLINWDFIETQAHTEGPQRSPVDPIVESRDAKVDIDNPQVALFGCYDTRPVRRGMLPDEDPNDLLFINAMDGHTIIYVPFGEVKSVTWYFYVCQPGFTQQIVRVPMYVGFYVYPAGDEVLMRDTVECRPDEKAPESKTIDAVGRVDVGELSTECIDAHTFITNMQTMDRLRFSIAMPNVNAGSVKSGRNSFYE